MYCSNCGTANSPDSGDVRYCRSCGADLLSQAGQLPGAYSSTKIPGVAADGPPPMPGPAGYMQAAVFPYGGFWLRLVAYVLDTAIIVLAAIVLGFAIGIAAYAGDMSEAAASDAATLLGMGLNLLYFIVFPPTLGATPGKLLLGFHIVDRDGRHIGFGRAILRLIGHFVSAMAFLLGYLWIGIDSRKQGWHDKIAGTYVVRKEFVRP